MMRAKNGMIQNRKSPRMKKLYISPYNQVCITVLCVCSCIITIHSTIGVMYICKYDSVMCVLLRSVD